MNNKIIGILMVIVGVILTLWGYDVYDSASAQVTRALEGDTPIEAWVGLGAGVFFIIWGLMKLK